MKNKKVRFLAVSFTALAACILLATCVYGLSVNVTPPRIEVTVTPGSEKSGFITVQNKDESGTMRIKAYVQDLVYLPDGSNDFLPVGSTPWTLGDAIKIGPTEFDVPAGKEVMLRYVVSLPKDARGGRYGVIFFESAVPPSEFKQTGANVNVRIGSILLVTAENTDTYKAKINRIDVKYDKGIAKVACTVYNQGNVIARPQGTVKFIDSSKATVAEIPINKDERGGVLPDTARTYYAEYKEPLAKGSYYAQVVLDYGGESLLGGQTRFEVG